MIYLAIRGSNFPLFNLNTFSVSHCLLRAAKSVQERVGFLDAEIEAYANG